MVIITKITSNISQKNATQNSSKLKNNIGQKKLTISCRAQNFKALFLESEFEVNIMYELIPIRKYKMPHTIGNNQPEGYKAGF